MKKVLEDEYGEKLSTTSSTTFDPVPIAAASIGQVYRAARRRARRRGEGPVPGRRPGRPGRHAEPRDDPAAHEVGSRRASTRRRSADEIRERIDEELDYELEAQNQRALARIFRGHPFIVVPDVLTSLSHERVIVSEFVEGRGFEELKQLPQDERDRLGEIIFRFYFGCMYRHRQFSGDPHPGNSLLLDDGRMAFLDFGLFKRIAARGRRARARVAAPRDRAARRRAPGDPARRAASSRGARHTPEGVLEQFHDITWWYTQDDEVPLDARRSRREVDHRDVRPALDALRARCATRRCRPTTSSAAAWRRSRWPSWGSCARPPTGTGSRASGSTATTR